MPGEADHARVAGLHEVAIRPGAEDDAGRILVRMREDHRARAELVLARGPLQQQRRVEDPVRRSDDEIDQHPGRDPPRAAPELATPDAKRPYPGPVAALPQQELRAGAGGIADVEPVVAGGAGCEIDA